MSRAAGSEQTPAAATAAPEAAASAPAARADIAGAGAAAAPATAAAAGAPAAAAAVSDAKQQDAKSDGKGEAKADATVEVKEPPPIVLPAATLKYKTVSEFQREADLQRKIADGEFGLANCCVLHLLNELVVVQNTPIPLCIS